MRLCYNHVTGKDSAAVLFDALRQPHANVLIPSDFRNLVRVVLDTHPGLTFLQSTQEFQERYMETILVRIFYNTKCGHTGRMSLRELRKSGLLSTLAVIDLDPDINKSLDLFAYEHFYVIYCKFWELDTDHDMIIDTEDFARYGNGSLTRKIVERISSMVTLPRDAELTRLVQSRARRSRTPSRLMTYQDFIWFILSEEDKTTIAAQDYWFRVIDIDGNGFWSGYELEYFYNSTIPKLQALGSEPPPFKDLLCQWLDMLNVQIPASSRIFLQDLLSCKLAPAILNALINPLKFLAFETKDPFVALDPPDAASDWVRFAQSEYELALMSGVEDE